MYTYNVSIVYNVHMMNGRSLKPKLNFVCQVCFGCRFLAANGPDHGNSPLLTLNDHGGDMIPLEYSEDGTGGNRTYPTSRRESRKSVSLSALNHSCLPGSSSVLSLQFGDDIRGIDDTGSQRAVFGALGISLTTNDT